jgi:hypothetical protein
LDGLVFAGSDPPDQFFELGEECRQQGENQRDQDIRERISGSLLAKALEDRLGG